MQSEQFGPYRIEALIGRGGMGEVYRAFDTEHERTVALKVLSEHLAADRGYRERFRREAHLAARLAEPHVIPIHRYGEVDGRLFLDMRLVHGDDVATVLAREGRMDPVRAVSIVSQVARALDAAHADGLVHRDVKPSNVLLTGSGDGEFAYLVDFGIARSTTDAQGPALTQTGAALGSFDYMAPERFLERGIDHRVDVYALACVLFECLTGRRPFPTTGLAAQMFAHVNTQADPPSAVVPGLPAQLDAVVARGLAKDPAARWSSAGELAAAARAALAGAGGQGWAVAVPQSPPGGPAPSGHPRTIGFTDPSGGSPGTGGGTGGGFGTPGGTGGGFAPAAGPGPGPGSWSAPPVPPGPPFGPGTAQPAPWSSSPPQQTSPGLLVALATTVVVAVMVVVAVVVTRSGGDGGTSVSAAPTTDAPTTSADPTSTATSTSPPDDDTATEALLARLPADFEEQDCEEYQLPSDGAEAAVECGGSISGTGPEAARFYGYPDVETLRDAFQGDVDRNGLTRVTAEDGCPGTPGWLDYNGADGVEAGSVACFVDADGFGIIFWTQEDALAEGYVAVSDGEADLAALWEWWVDSTKSDFQVG
ncbi:serine/threonine-protein kinase [Klenkia sp. LSe6-5]|uniref:non-specific serine/threonine protein kinase n=1 Tax=Klenkia sesuvii TaxID=3103137 RepID=A0ABU8DSD3_9ACTN